MRRFTNAILAIVLSVSFCAPALGQQHGRQGQRGARPARSYVSAATGARDDFKVLLGGSFDCQTGKVKVSKGELAKQEFPTLDAAQAALARVYNKAGVDKLAGLLKDVCEEKGDAQSNHGWEEKPIWKPGGPATAEYRQPGSAVEFNKEGSLVTFKVSEFEDDFPATDASAARHYIDKMSDKKRCRPISSVCWKCPDGRIICSTPKVSK